MTAKTSVRPSAINSQLVVSYVCDGLRGNVV